MNATPMTSAWRRPAGRSLRRRTPTLKLSLVLGSIAGVVFAVPRARASGAETAAPAPAAPPALEATTTPSTSDVLVTNYAFASELGSGIYSIGGRTIQVYSIPIGFQLRAATKGRPPPGIKFLIPITFGFFNFQPADVVQLHFPDNIAAVSLEPGLELDYWMSDAWHLYPYAKAGTSFATSTTVDAVIYGFGLRSDYRFEELGGQGLWRAILAYAGVNYLTSVPNDRFTRLRDGAELRRDIGLSIGGRAVQLAPYGMLDIYLKAPSGPQSGISTQTVQFQLGLMLGVNPMWEIFPGTQFPRIGVGYQFAGVLSGWRLVLGDPF